GGLVEPHQAAIAPVHDQGAVRGGGGGLAVAAQQADQAAAAAAVLGLAAVDQGFQGRPQALAVHRFQLPAPVQEAQHPVQAPVGAGGDQDGGQAQRPPQLAQQQADRHRQGVEDQQPDQR